MQQKTFIMVKPDGVQRGLVGEVVKRFESKGFKLIAMKFMQIERPRAERHYEMHKGKDFYEPLVKFMTSAPVVAMVWEADNAVDIGRRILGATRPSEAQPGTIRGDLCISTQFNIVHASDSPENAVREIEIFFDAKELQAYERTISKWMGGEA
jgi:nucleoside-diphosphate kinase